MSGTGAPQPNSGPAHHDPTGTVVWGEMPTSGGMVPPSLETVSVPVRPQHNTHFLVVLALALGLVLTATAAGMIWFLSGRDAWATEMLPSDAKRDAHAACVLLAKSQLITAASLAQAATNADPHYRPLAEALTHANHATGPQRASALANARRACDKK